MKLKLPLLLMTAALALPPCAPIVSAQSGPNPNARTIEVSGNGEARTSPKSKRLYRYLGQDTRIQIDYFHLPVELNDLVLLCTNGLWHMLPDAHIKEILSQGGDPQKLARILVDDANLAGGDGNVSAIVVGIQ